MSDLKDFLENIRKFSPKIGEVAMQHVSERIGLIIESIGKEYTGESKIKNLF